MDPFALRSELLMSAFTPQEFQHWQDAAANLVSSSRRTSPILGAKGEGESHTGCFKETIQFLSKNLRNIKQYIILQILMLSFEPTSIVQ